MEWYAVPVQHPPKFLKPAIVAAVKRFVEEPTRNSTLSVLPERLFEVEVRSKDKLPPVHVEALSALGAGADEVAAFKRAKQFVVVRTWNQPEWPPNHQYVGIAAASALAAAEKSIVVDLSVSMIRSPREILQKLPTYKKPYRFFDWLRIVYSCSDTGLWMTSMGMSSSGLPELQTIDVPPQIQEFWTQVMTTVASKILVPFGDRSINSATYDLPAAVQLTDSDIAGIYHRETMHKGKTTIHLRLAKGKNGCEFLTIVPPPTHTRSAGEYMVETCRELFGSAEEGIDITNHSPAMEKAIATARASLPKIRERFLTDQLPPHGQLLVKFRITKGTDNEYLWANVTGWKSPIEVKATCGNNADLDSELRSGKPLTLKIDSIVDWGVLVDDEFVEGAWTHKVLGH
jgi:hypothetical protein